jgi:integrase
MRLTDLTVQKLPAPERGQKLYTDDTLPGFGIRVSQGGSRSFVVILGAERRRITIGRYPIVSLAKARERARTILAERQLGIVEKPSPIFKVVQEEYLLQRDDKLRSSTRQADGYLFKPFDGFSQKKMADISAENIEDIIKGLDAPSTRHHAFLRVKGLFAYAVKRGYIDRSPVDRLDCPPVEDPRERVLTSNELRKVIVTARQYPHAYGTIVELCAITGQRRMQIGALREQYVDFDAGTITWPPQLMKTARRHVIPLSDLTRALLSDITPNEDGFYFPSRVNSPFVGWSYHKARFDSMHKVSDFRLHDLRRTLATHWQEMGVEIATTEKYLSHSLITGGLVGIYQRSAYLEQMRAAVRLWEDWVQALLSNTESNNAKFPGLRHERA